MPALVFDYSLRIVIAAAAVGLVLVVFRVRSGAARHAAWSSVLLAMLTMPALTAIVPRVEVPVPSTLALDPGTIAGRYGDEELLPNPIAAEREGAPAPTNVAASTLERPRVVSPSEHPSFDWTRVAAGVYAAGLLWFAARIGVGWVITRRLVSKATFIRQDGSARVLESGDIAAPVTTGLLAPAIVLPADWRTWPRETMDAVLAHEQAHVARRDVLVSLLAHTNRAIFWFHPLSWWLLRAISTAAEHACDERVVRQIAEPRRYAGILVRMAEAVSRRGSRVAWPAVGVDGLGLLGSRVDRLLQGDVLDRMSVSRRLLITAGCASAILLAVACRQQVAATPLRPDPDVQRSLEANRERTERYHAAISTTPADAAKLEASLEQNPSDLDTRERLLTYYRMSDSVQWNDKLAGTRRHTLWVIEYAPDSRVWVPVLSKRYDPAGYEAAKQLWLEQTAGPGVSVKVLARAADFLSSYDKPLAEELILRAREMDPDGASIRASTEPGIAAPSWSSRLGELYARAIAGNVDRAYGANDPAEAAGPFAEEARRKLDATTDARVLRAAAAYLSTRSRNSPKHQTLARTYIERAVQFDPDDLQARVYLASAITNERTQSISARLRAEGARDRFDEFSDVTSLAISNLPVSDRLFYLPRAAESAYMRAESIEYTGRKEPEAERAEANRKAQAGWTRARQYAEDALTLAAANTSAPEYAEAIYRANVVLGVLALKDADRRASVAYMDRAVAVAGSESFSYSANPGLRGRLVEYLLRDGERESVADFLERSAALSLASKERLLKDAQQIRAGIMPAAYQHADARWVLSR